MKTKVSVLMSVYNTKEEWLRQAIESVLSQTLQEIEFLIVIDCPTDDSQSVVESYARMDDRIRILYNEKNLGLPQSLNKGIAVAAGDYIARMDSDDVAIRDRLEKQLQYIEDRQLDIVGARIVRIDGDGNVISAPTVCYKEKIIGEALQHADCVPHPTWLVRKEVYRELNGYRSIRHCEDYDFLLRAVRKNCRIGVCDEVLLNYRINTSGITRSNSLAQHLTSEYLRKNVGRIEEVTQEEIDREVKDKATGKSAENFEASVSLFRSGVEKIKSRKLLSGAVSILCGLLKSRYAYSNLKNILAMRRIAKQG